MRRGGTFMKKRICSLLLAIAILLPILPTVGAEDSYRFLYSKQSNDLQVVQIEITGYEGTLPETLVIPEQIEGIPVRSISNRAFKNAPIKEVILPGTIETLNTTAFAENETLEAVTVGEGTKVISRAFSNCINLKSVTLPSTIQELGYEAFCCTALENVQFPKGLKTIGKSCFEFCMLKSIDLPEGIERIEDCAFWGNEAQGRLMIPASVKSLGSICFSDNCFSDVVILSEDVKISGFPFDWGTVVYAHESVWESSDYAGFPHHQTVSFEELPYDVLTQPVYTEGAIQYTTVDGQAYVISCYASGELTLPDTLGGCPVKALQPSAFVNAYGLTHLVLPDSIEEIGKRCFFGCSATIEKLPKNLKKIGFAAFYSEGENAMTLLDGTIPEGVTVLLADTFHGTKMDEIVLPAGLEKIGGSAFAGTDAQSVTFLGGVKYVGSHAFYGIKAKKIVFPEGLEYLGSWAFGRADQLESITFPSTLREMENYLFGYDAPENLTVYGYTDTPILDYCLNAGIQFVDVQTGEPVAKIYETELDGVRYRVNPAKKYASIVGCVPEKLDSILVLPETVDGCPVTAIECWGLDRISCKGIILPDTITFIDDLAITSADPNFLPVFISMPDNEVYIDKNFINGNPSYFYLPENFSLAEGCRANASQILKARCIGFEKHKEFLDEGRLITIDDHADSRHVLTTGGVFRVDGEELTAILLTSVYPMVSSVSGMPVTRIAESCRICSTRIILGDYVRVVEDGAIIEEGPYESIYINDLYLPPCIEYLPPDMVHCPDITTIYGTTGTYAETYAKEHGCKFLDMEKTPFRDVSESAWYFPYVHEVFWYHLMNGTGETTFEPEATTTRAMVVQVLFNLSGRESYGERMVFTDVGYDDWFFDAVYWAQLCGVCNGTSKTTFSPNDPVTREQLAAFLYRYAKLCGYDCQPDGNLSAYKDRNQISSYARDAISWAVGAGIINGTSATTIEPQSNATRAEIAAMLCRLLDFVEQSEPMS